MPKPCAPDRPVLQPAGPTSLRISWTLPPIEPEITASTIKLRIQGSQRWQNYDHRSERLVAKGGSTVPAPTCEVVVEGCMEGLAYEAIVAVMNSDGWSDISQPSLPVCIGELKTRGKPAKPEPPALIALGAGKLKVTWSVPEACPPIEAAQVQITDVSSGMGLLVDASSGKLVPAGSGRTTFVATRTEANIVNASDGVEYVAALCFRNAEGFSEFSSPSEPVANPQADVSGMQLVLHQGPSTEVPLMEPTTEGKMKIRWLLPDGAKSTTVKLRRVGSQNWYLCGGSAIPEPACETVATGLEEGIEYESTISFLINGRWGSESAVSKPACIGAKKLPGIPDAPKEPRLVVLSEQSGQMRVTWRPITTVPAVTGCAVKMRQVGARQWQYVHPSTWQLSPRDEGFVPSPASEVNVVGLTPGVRYEAMIAFRNKLGQGPFSQPSEVACIGRPTQKLIRCTYCLNDYDLQHATYSRDPESFWCPLCRFRNMDPFHAVAEPYGMLLCHILVRPNITFSLDLPDLKSWRKEDQSIFMRMCKVNSDKCSQVWPRRILFEANGAKVFEVKEPEEGHVRRDVPQNISAGLKPGLNTISITIEDDYVAGYVMSLVRCQTLNAQQIAAMTPQCVEEQAKARVMTLLADTWATPVDNEDEEEITCVISNKLKLRCPLSFERCVIPVRGEQCMHLQCFGLQAYLESNMKMRALNNRWTCPVCSTVLRPQDLRIDGYVEKVLSETPSHIDEVLIMQDGSYRCIEELPDPQAAAAREREAKEAAAAAMAKAEADGEVTEMYQTIADGDDRKRKASSMQPSVQKTLTKRQRLRREKQRTAAAAGSENDSDPVAD